MLQARIWDSLDQALGWPHSVFDNGVSAANLLMHL